MPSAPNATCPICGARVYFWKNRDGSKVWFDALGRPWPRHPCLELPNLPWSRSRDTVLHARLSATGPLPATRNVKITGSDGSGCGCLLLAVAAFLILCVINWWGQISADSVNSGRVWSTIAGTAVVTVALVSGQRLWAAFARLREFDRAFLARERGL